MVFPTCVGMNRAGIHYFVIVKLCSPHAWGKGPLHIRFDLF